MKIIFHHLLGVLILCLILFAPGVSGQADYPTPLVSTSPIEESPVATLQGNSPYTPSDEHWADIFYPPGADFYVNAFAVYGNDLYIGGSFSILGNVQVFGIARWDGSAVHPLGSIYAVRALVVDTSGNLYAGTVSGVYQWDGSTWHLLDGSGMDGLVFTLAVDGNGNLYGSNSYSEIYQWNGSTWLPLGNVMDGYVNALAVDSSGNLYAGGSFTIVGGVLVSNIAVWDGSTWHNLEGGMDGPVSGLCVDSSGNLYAGGIFTSAGNVNANHIARWDGNSWHALGSGVNDSIVALTMGGAGNLYVASQFATSEGVNARISIWDGSTWQSIQDEIDGEVETLAVEPGQNLYVAGNFSAAGGVYAHYLAKWDGTQWSPLIDGGQWIGGRILEDNIFAAVVDTNGNLYAGGRFDAAGGISTNSIAMWDGNAWHPLGNGIDGAVYALAIGQNGYLYAGGEFTSAGGINANHIAMWDGSAWHPLGSGVNDYVFALAVDDNGTLYAGGWFNTAGGISTNNIARWDGTSWYSLANGLSGSYASMVLALAVDISGNLYAGGEFTAAGETYVNNIAMWDGSIWQPLGSGIDKVSYNQETLNILSPLPGDSPVHALTLDKNGNLYAGGWFTNAGGVTANDVAMWDGEAWHALANGIDYPPLPASYTPVNALITDDNGNLYAGGNFTAASGRKIRSIARWNGHFWGPLGSGIYGWYGAPEAFAIDDSAHLYVVGRFDWAGGKGSLNIARWDIPPSVEIYLPLLHQNTSLPEL